MRLHEGKKIRVNIGEVKEVVLDAELGTGGTGRVWKVRNLSPLDTDYYVIKHIKLHPKLEPRKKSQLVQRIKREASVNIDSEYIIRCLGYSEPKSDNFILLFPYTPGQDLGEWIRKNRRSAWGTRKKLFLKILEGVRALHTAKIVHRDLKPENVLVSRYYRIPRIIDFGLAKFRNQGRITQHGLVAGTPAYMAPEVLPWGIKEVDERCDIYAMGIILYELVIAQNPWEANGFEIGDFIRHLQRDDTHNIFDIDTNFRFTKDNTVKEVIRRSTMFEPTLRTQTIDAMIKQLHGQVPPLREVQPVPSPTPSRETKEAVRLTLNYGQKQLHVRKPSVSKYKPLKIALLIISAILLIVAIIIGGVWGRQYASGWWKSFRSRFRTTSREKSEPAIPTPVHGLKDREVEDLNKILGAVQTPTPEPEKEVDQKELEDILKQQNPSDGSQ